MPGRGGLRPVAELLLRRDGGVPGGDRGGARRAARLHRDESADPGRAHGHRGDHRRRPGPVPDADRLRRVAGRSRSLTGHSPDQRRGPAVPDHHRGPGQRLPTRHRDDHGLPHRGRRRRPAGRWHGRHRRRGQRPLRLDAGQAHLSRPDLRPGRAARPACPGRVPHPRRQHQHSLPPGGSGGSGLHRRRRLDRLHRAAPRAAHHPRPGRPRHPAAAVAGRGDGQQAVRRSAHPARPGGEAARRRRPVAALTGGLPAAAARARARPASPPTCGPASTSRSPTPPSGTPTSRCSPPGCGPRTCCGSPRTWAG